MNWLNVMTQRIVNNARENQKVFECSIEEAFEITLSDSVAGEKTIKEAKKILNIK